MSTCILVVDDERPLVNLLRAYLEREAFSVIEALDGPAAIEQARRHSPDVIVLDWMLPRLSGPQLLQEIRRFTDAYVIMLTARSEEADKLVGLSAGADDYLTKPFSPAELVLRVHALLRRPRGLGTPAVKTPIHLGGLVVDPDRHEVQLDGVRRELTASEFKVLVALASNLGSVLTRGQLLEHVNGPAHYGSEHIIDVHVANIRKKLGWTGKGAGEIHTVRGVGYRLQL